VRRLPEVVALSPARQTQIVSEAWVWLMLASIGGNFLAASIARRLGYKRTIALMALAYFLTMTFTYGVPRTLASLWWCLPVLGCCSGFFALFTMYLPPLFPTLLRTTGAGFSYNIGRIAAAAGTVIFGLMAPIGDKRLALFYSGLLFLPAALIALAMPEVEQPPEEPENVDPTANVNSATDREVLEEVYRERGCSG
jgi:MFS family permease